MPMPWQWAVQRAPPQQRPGVLVHLQQVLGPLQGLMLSGLGQEQGRAGVVDWSRG